MWALRIDRARSWRRTPALVAVVAVAAVGAATLTGWKPSRSASVGGAGHPVAVIGAGFEPQMVLLRAVLAPPVVPAGFASTALYRRHPANRPLRIMVVGDSVGVSFERGLRLWAARHDAQVLGASRMWCALGRTLPISHGLALDPPGEGCGGWTSRWANDIDQFDPDVVFVNFTIWEMALRLLPGQRDPVQPGNPQLDAWQLSEYRAAADVLSARGASVVWFTAPCEGTPIADRSPLWYVNRRTIPALAASRPAVHVVDLDHELCAGGAGTDYAGVNARPDGAHFSPAGALAVADWVMPIVLGQRPNPRTADERVPPAAPRGAVTRTAD